jgi:heme exporter protein C
MKISNNTPMTLIVIDLTAGIFIAVALYMVFQYAPVEIAMGLVQKIFYFHVAAGWTGMLGFLVSFIAAIVFLRSGRSNWDIAGLAGIEIGMVFVALNIISGSIWARPIWNTWWTWDPRLTTALIMELIYASYLLLRNSVEDLTRRAKFGAVYAIVGFVSVPLTFLSIRIFRTIHPILISSGNPGAAGASDMSPRMTQTFLVSLAAFTILFIALFWHRIRLGSKQALLEEKRLHQMDEQE